MTNFVKSNFLMKITTIEREINDEGKEVLKVVNEEWVKERAKNFYASMNEELSKGINRPIQIVAAAPQKFQLGTIYIRMDGKQVYIYKEATK